MKLNELEAVNSAQSKFLLAMHSSSETLGVAVLDIRNPNRSRKNSTFSLGKQLSNSLISCIETVLPNKKWHQLGRIAVATGPGGFTGTRLTVLMARTLSQQIGCPLDGISSFALMAPRLSKELKPDERFKPFWIFKEVNRRGNVAGQYLIENESKFSSNTVLELKPPQLFPEDFESTPAIYAEENVIADVNQLLNVSLKAHETGRNAPWSKVLPIYPTSPVKDN